MRIRNTDQPYETSILGTTSVSLCVFTFVDCVSVYVSVCPLTYGSAVRILIFHSTSLAHTSTHASCVYLTRIAIPFIDVIF